MHPPMSVEGSRVAAPSDVEKPQDNNGRYSPDPTESMSHNSESPKMDFFNAGITPNPLAPAGSAEVVNGFPRVVTTSTMQPPVPHPHQQPDADPQQQHRRRHSGKGRLQGTTASGGAEENTVKRRQKRLERNRESARLSRRRRKQYLEVLEENVNRLSREMDRGRREHVARAIWTIHQKRMDILVEAPSLDKLERLETSLSRTSDVLRIVNTFHWQQLQSFVLPPSTKFALWLTLQNDAYFRGGRAASERLSAARIGERMLTSGTDKVTPSQSMWPLFCNEVGLSYEQEEKVRSYQRTMLQTPETWLHRHTAFAAEKTMQSMHDAIEALTYRLGQRERKSQSILTPEQRLKLATWATRNREKLKNRIARVPREEDSFKVSKDQHEAANLYIINHRLNNVLTSIPAPAVPAVDPRMVKKLSRRPLFESLGCAGEKEEGLSRDSSFSSTGSLKRGMEEMNMGAGEDEERMQLAPLNPEDAQASCAGLVDKVLGHVKSIIPHQSAPAYVALGPTKLMLPAPTPVASMQYFANPTPAPLEVPSENFVKKLKQSPPQAPTPPPPPAPTQPPQPTQPQPPIQAPVAEPSHPGIVSTKAEESKHTRKSSFLPPHLNVVPEEMWTGDAEELLMNLVDGDWAIGEGIDMDHVHS